MSPASPSRSGISHTVCGVKPSSDNLVIATHLGFGEQKPKAATNRWSHEDVRFSPAVAPTPGTNSPAQLRDMQRGIGPDGDMVIGSLGGSGASGLISDSSEEENEVARIHPAVEAGPINKTDPAVAGYSGLRAPSRTRLSCSASSPPGMNHVPRRVNWLWAWRKQVSCLAHQERGRRQSFLARRPSHALARARNLDGVPSRPHHAGSRDRKNRYKES